jgi:hypothetical protein
MFTSFTPSAKYPLAIANKIIDIFGDDQGVGYDIGCKAKATISHSSISAKAREHRFKFIVNAFHGHAHNRRCQLCNHPLYQKGIGLEDLETCERVFAASNIATRLLRHASHFHWLQFLELHFELWNEDKYLELSL